MDAAGDAWPERVANGECPGGVPLSEAGASGASPASPEPQARGPRRASRLATKPAYPLPQRILQAFEECGAGKGLSLADLRKRLAEAGCPVPRRNSRLQRELNGLVSHGLLARAAGPGGASGLFRMRRQTKRAGQAEPGGKAKPAAAKSSREAPKKTQKKKPPPGNKPKRSVQRRAAPNPGKKKRLDNNRAGSRRNLSAKKGPRRQ
ncbi:histone H1.5-like [Paroedura picta]|uniref:histone H1.5-like n=1 Tax=Paroedura picta TaxID=143630 RepID=UPI0040573343